MLDALATVPDSRGINLYLADPALRQLAGLYLPPDLLGIAWRGRYRGQRQRWFALRFTGEDSDIRLDLDPHPEFDAWRWVSLAELPALAVPFKRAIYDVLTESFARFAGG